MRAPAALASIGLALSGLRTVGAEPCPPRAVLDGDSAAIAYVTDELHKLGVEVSRVPRDGAAPRAFADDGCVTVRAQVALEPGGGIAVAVHGASRGSEGRVVSDAALAAAWIDSWTRQDADLWAGPSALASNSAARGAPGAVEQRGDLRSMSPGDLRSMSPGAGDPPVDSRAGQRADTDPRTGPHLDTASTTASSSRWERVALSASYVQAWSDDDATWRGLDVSACAQLASGFCVGGSVRATFDAERLHNATGVARSDLSVLALARYPVGIGRMTIAPELGVGVGRLATRRAEGTCKPPVPTMCDPMTDPMCAPEAGMCEPNDPGGTTMTPKYYVGDAFSAATYAPRVALALRVAVPLFEHVWLDGLAGYTFSPFGHGSSFDAGIDANVIAPELITLPGEPTGGYAVGIGLRVGAR